jgi:hypothetical protein
MTAAKLIDHEHPSTAQLLIDAAVALKGVEEVQRHLAASDSDFQKWREGTRDPPVPAFDRLVTFVIEGQEAQIRKTRSLKASLGPA